MKTTEGFVAMATMLFAMIIDQSASGQTVAGGGEPGFASNIIVPQSRAFHVTGAAELEITEVLAGVVIYEQVATTTIDIQIRNLTRRPTQAEILLPVPGGVTIRGFAFDGGASRSGATLMPKSEARSAYKAIVAKTRDPALLEFLDCSMIRSSVFPVSAAGTQRIRVTYEQILPRDGQQVQYTLPRSEKLMGSPPWSITARIQSRMPITAVYSPSHELERKRTGPGEVSVRTERDAAPGSFHLFYAVNADGPEASVLSYARPGDEAGYFLLLLGAPPPIGMEGVGVGREVTLVIDHSGSMSGNKLEQVRAAALQVLGGLNDGEAFNIIAYNHRIMSLSGEAVIKTASTERDARSFLNALRAEGGTDIHSALVNALSAPARKGMLPIVLFLTDGLPTVGETAELTIRRVAKDRNPFSRRIFTFGVGVDVNAPLLSILASETRGTPTTVLPEEDVEVKVAKVFGQLKGPVLTDARFELTSQNGGTRLSDLMPRRLPDLYKDDQIVLLGRYFGTAPVELLLQGQYLGEPRTFRVRFDPTRASSRHDFIPRLWASRRIGELSDEIRQLGADHVTGFGSAIDSRIARLTEEIVRLGTEFGILTEYTAFLALEGTDLSRRSEVLTQARRNFQDRAIMTRSGLGAVSQTANLASQSQQSVINMTNSLVNERMERVDYLTVQQVHGGAFYRRGGQWLDARIASRPGTPRPSRIVTFGTSEFDQLADRLAAAGRLSVLALDGEVMLELDGEMVLVRGPQAAP